MTDYNAIYDSLNSAGVGYAVGSDDDINELADELNAELIYRAYTDDDVAVYRDENGDLILVGDAHGPWAVKIPGEAEHLADGWVVVDASNQRWWPDADAQEEIEKASDPAVAVVVMAALDPSRGEWRT